MRSLYSPPSRSRWLTWAWLAMALVICAPPIVVRLDDRVSTHTMENVALVSSQETWLRLHQGDARALWMAFNDARPRVEKPPLVVWLNFAAWSDLDPANHDPDVLAWRARLVSAAMGLLMIASIYWMGAAIGSRQTALIATLAAGSMFFVHRQAQTASYDIHFSAWSALALAAGLWAININGALPAMRRRFAGWTICALAMACAMMSKNPLALAIVIPPLGAAIALSPKPRRTRWLGLVAALLVSLAPICAWFAVVYSQWPEALHVWWEETKQSRPGDFQPVYYYLGVLALVFPWTPWLVTALVQAYRKRTHQWGRAAWFVLLWFAYIFVLFSIPPAKQQRYILPIIAPASLLVALLWTHLAQHMQGSRSWLHILGQACAVVLLIMSLALAPFVVMQQSIAARLPRILPEPILDPFSWPVAILLSIILSVAAIMVWIAHRRQYGVRAMMCLAVWAIVLATALWSRYKGSPERVREVESYRAEARRVAEIVGDSPMRIVRRGGFRRINEEFRFYFASLIEPIAFNELRKDPASVSSSTFVFARPDERVTSLLNRIGFELIDHVHADKDDTLELWRRCDEATDDAVERIE